MIVNLLTRSSLSGIILLSLFSTTLSSQENVDDSKPALTLEASYIGDNVNNLAGGAKRGSAYLGMLNLNIGFDTKSAGLWKGGKFYLHGANTHGASPSEQLIGDFQVTSNIEAGNHTYLQEFWYSQTLGPVEIIAGLQDMNVEFANSDYGALFLNSSFGIHPTISGNIPAPIFPLTSLGFTLKWQISSAIGWRNAIFDGNPTEFEKNPYNTKWKLNRNDGILYITEFQYDYSISDKLPGKVKAGYYYHNHKTYLNDSTTERVTSKRYGFYMAADQNIWQQSEKSSLGLFGQLGFNPKKINQNRFYVGLGINYSGLFSKKGNDIIGLAVAHTDVDKNIDETTLELTYQANITKNIFIQPDIQYIINPAGTGNKLKNCLGGILRLGINL